MAHNLGEIVLFHRKESGLSRKQLADLSGVGKTVIYDIDKVLKALNITIKYESPLMEIFNEES